MTAVEDATLTPFLRRLHMPANDNIPVTMREAGERWVVACRKRGLERSTIRQYEQHLTYHIFPLLGPLPLQELTTPIVQSFADELIQVKTAATAKKALSSLKAILTEAQRAGILKDNVAKPVTVRRSKRDMAEIKIPSAKEVRATLAGAKPRWRALIATAALTGLRASELRGLGWRHVDTVGKVIRVRRRADRWNTLGPPKSQSGRRDVPFGDRLSEILEDHRACCPASEADLVFPNANGNVQPLSNVWRRGLAPAQRSAGILDEGGKPKFSMHAFRHFAASLFIASKRFTPKEIQVIIGHSSIVETFDVYGHLFTKRDDMAEVMLDIEETVFGS